MNWSSTTKPASPQRGYAGDASTAASAGLTIRVGLPHPGGGLVAYARERALPVLFSANAFMVRVGGEVVRCRYPDRAAFAGLDAALDSSGFTAAVHYRAFPFTAERYLDLASSFPWAWYAAMDLCCEPAVAQDHWAIMFRLAETVRMYGELASRARDRNMAAPVPVLQGSRVDEYLWSADHLPLGEWPDLVGIGSVCRRQVHGADGLVAIIEALDRVLPKQTRFHAFGVKGSALQVVGKHERLASIDSQAWDAACRFDHPRGRNMAVRTGYLQRWLDKNIALARGPQRPAPVVLGNFTASEPGPALQGWLDLVLSNDMHGPDAMMHAMRQLDHLIDEDQPDAA